MGPVYPWNDGNDYPIPSSVGCSDGSKLPPGKCCHVHSVQMFGNLEFLQGPASLRGANPGIQQGQFECTDFKVEPSRNLQGFPRQSCGQAPFPDKAATVEAGNHTGTEEILGIQKQSSIPGQFLNQQLYSIKSRRRSEVSSVRFLVGGFFPHVGVGSKSRGTLSGREDLQQFKVRSENPT